MHVTKKQKMIGSAIFSTAILVLSAAAAITQITLLHYAYADTGTDTCENQRITKITSSSSDTNPLNAIDNDPDTRWIGEGKGSWIKPDLEEDRTICYLDVTWYKGNSRQYDFVISVSSDGQEWTNVYDGKSSGETLSAERYDFGDISARWIKIRFNSNQWDNVNEIIEMNVYTRGASDGGTSNPDTTDPSIKITTPSDDSTLSAGTIVVKGTAFDDDGGSGIQKVEVHLDDGSYSTATPKAPGDWSTWSISLDNVSPSSSRITSRATDNAGNQDWDSVDVSVIYKLDNNVISDSGGNGKKYFLATIVQYVDIDKMVDIYKPNLVSTDKSRIHAGLNKDVTDEQFKGLLSLSGAHGVEFFSLAEIKKYAPILKSKGAEFIDYDLEPGDNHSPYRDLSDPVSSIRDASRVAHDNGLLFQCSPSKSITTTYGSQLAQYCDQYHIQAQSLQGDPDEYNSYVDTMVPKLRANNPNIEISVQVSTQRESADGMNILQTMKHDFSLVDDKVDGISVWYSTDALQTLESFSEWFDSNYR